MEFFTKVEHAPTPDLTWNIPEQNQGTVNIIGGNSQSFRTSVKISEYLVSHYPIKTLRTLLPDSLKSKLPDLPNFNFLSSTESGSFASADELASFINSADYSLILGDFSKNAITMKAVSTACQNSEKPLLITRDALDLVVENSPERLLMNNNIVLFASMPQLIKLFRAVYYPRMLLLSQSLVQVVDALHKFTLSYPVKIITLHSEQLIIAVNGEVKSVPLAKSGYLPLTAWNGELATKILALNLYNPNNFIDATLTGIISA